MNINLDIAAQSRLTLRVGTYNYFYIDVTDENDDPYDFTNYTAKCQIRNIKSNKNIIIRELTVALSTGKIEVYDDTPSSTTTGVFSWGLELTYPDGKTRSWIVGVAVLTDDYAK